MAKFVDLAKEEVLYAYEGGSDDVRMMLERGDANSRINMEMGRWQMSVKGDTSTWLGNWCDLFDDVVDELERAYVVLNGYSRVQAIEMRGKGSVGQSEVLEKKERSGIASLFSGGK